MYTVGIYTEDDLYKARKGAEVGTVKEFKVKGVLKKYIKTANGWRPYGKKKQAADEEAKKNQSSSSEEEVSQNKTTSIEDQAKNASDKQLEAAINDPNQKEEIKNAAKKELESRRQNSLEGENKDKKTKENTSEQESEEKKIKQITQTYVKVDGGQIIIRMNKEKTRYKASKGGFKLESQEGEDISDFKKRVKEEYQKREEIKNEVREEVKKEQEKESQKESEKVEESKPSKEEEDSKGEVKEEKLQESKDSNKEDKAITKFKGFHTIETPSGDKITCIMNSEQTEYIAMKGAKFNVHSKEGEDLPEFEQRVKEEYSKFLSENKKTASKKKQKEQSTPKKEIKKEVQKEIKSTKSSGKSSFKNNATTGDRRLTSEEQKEYIDILDSIKSLKGIRERNPSVFEKAEKIVAENNWAKVSEAFNGETINKNLQIALNYELIKKGFAPYTVPFMYEKYNGAKYKIFDQSTTDRDQGIFDIMEWSNCFDFVKGLTNSERQGLHAYSKGYDAMIRESLTRNDKNDQDITEWIKGIDSAMKKYKLKGNLVLSRRVNLGSKEAQKLFESLSVGSEFTDKSFTSFSSYQLDQFGSFQITLLAKKGQHCTPMMGVSEYRGEAEFLLPRDTKYRVVQVGSNSITVEVVQ